MEHHKGNLKQNIIVTGAGGLIGSHVVHACYHAGYNVTGVYHTRRHKECVWNAVYADFLDRESLPILDAMNPHVIIHCAAVLPKGLHNEELERAAAFNSSIDATILQFCQEHRHTVLIYPSGTSVYGNVDFVCHEESPVFPKGAYVMGKWETEKKIRGSKNRAFIFRISSPYGLHQQSRTVLRIFIEHAMNNIDLHYYGSGRRQQDFVAAADVAQACLCAIESKNARGIFNIASGKSISMKDLAELIVKIVPNTTSRVVASGQPDVNEAYRPSFDITRAQKRLGWHPSIFLEEGLRRWVQNWGQSH